jgi:serine/threonine protein kinase
VAGTPYYMAPETIDGKNCDPKADMWSLGVLLYIMMSGYLPFQAKTTPQIFEKIQKGSYHFKHTEFQLVSEESKDLISKLLVVYPSKRLSSDEMLEHPWF